MKKVRSRKRSNQERMNKRDFIPVKFFDYDADNLFKKPPKMKKVLLNIILISTALIAFVWIHIQIDTTSSDIMKLIEQKNFLENKNHHDKQKIDELTKYNRVYSIVKSKFGMDYPKIEPKILIVPEDLLSNKESGN